MTASILVVDDLPAIREMLNQSLASEGYRVATAGSGEEAVTRLEEQEFDVIVTDLVMPGLGGLDVLEKARLLDPRAAVILMTAYASLDTAIAALRRGACDYLEKPFTMGDLKLRVRRLLQYREMVWRERLLQRALHPRPSGHTLIGESGAIRAVRDQIARSAGTSSNVLITGESGVGKELVARAVHAASARRDRAFIALLLRVIEEKHVWPVGGTRPVPVDVRIIASTNRDLASEVAGGRFRTDLFYRLNVLHLKLPPLRERRGDIPLLVDHLVDRLNAKLGTRFLGVERDALRALIGQPWKGNVRELENVLERAMVLGGGDLITLQDVSGDLTGPAGTLPRDLRGAVRRFERQHVMEVVAEARSDKREAAHVLGISLASLYRKLSPAIDEPAPAPGG